MFEYDYDDNFQNIHSHDLFKKTVNSWRRIIKTSEHIFHFSRALLIIWRPSERRSNTKTHYKWRALNNESSAASLTPLREYRPNTRRNSAIRARRTHAIISWNGWRHLGLRIAGISRNIGLVSFVAVCVRFLCNVFVGYVKCNDALLLAIALVFTGFRKMRVIIEKMNVRFDYLRRFDRIFKLWFSFFFDLSVLTFEC